MHAYGLSTYYALDLGGAVRKDRARDGFRTDVFEDVEQRAPGTAAGPTNGSKLSLLALLRIQLNYVVLTKRGSRTKSIAPSSKITTIFSKNLHKSLY